MEETLKCITSVDQKLTDNSPEVNTSLLAGSKKLFFFLRY